MKSITPPQRSRVRRLVVISLLSFATAAALFAFAVSASRKASREGNGPTINATKSPANLSLSSSKTKNSNAQQGNAPLAPNITATLTDNVAAATKVVPGGTINYTAVITNTGVSPTDDATNLIYSDTL